MSGTTFGACGDARCTDEEGWAAARHRHRLRIVGDAEALMLGLADHGGMPLSVVCRRVGVSERALRTAFICVYGVSPGRYVRDRRLALVRETLLAAPERPSAVKQAALTFGFRHLGHFAQAYRARFGELPSETIARSRARPDQGGDAAIPFGTELMGMER